MNEERAGELSPTNNDDCSALSQTSGSSETSSLSELARPMLDMKAPRYFVGNSGFAGSRSARYVYVDETTQIMLPYGLPGGERSAFTSLITKDNRVGLMAVAQAYLMWPALLASYVAIMLLPALHVSRGIVACLAFSVLLLTFLSVLTAIQVSLVQRKRKSGTLANAIDPTHVIVSPVGITLQWRGWGTSFRGLANSWSTFAAVFVEEHARTDGKMFEVICFKQQAGHELRLDARAFRPEDLNFLKAAAKRFAPDAAKLPSLSRVLQPSQKSSIRYVFKWCSSLRGGWFRVLGVPPRRKATAVCLPAGTTLKGGQYAVIEPMSRSMTGISYLAEMNELGERRRSVSVHELFDKESRATHESRLVRVDQYVIPDMDMPEYLNNILSMFESEVRLSTQWQHTSVEQWLDVFLDDKRLFVVYEHIPGMTLSRLVTECGALNETEALKVGVKICEILLAFYGSSDDLQGRTMECFYSPRLKSHAFLTPDSFKVSSSDNTVVLTDHRVARLMVSTANACPLFDWRYSAPEALHGAPILQSDIFSLGRILYFLLTAKQPSFNCPRHAKEINQSISERVDEIIACMTEPDLTKRYKTIEECLEELSSAQVSVPALTCA